MNTDDARKILSQPIRIGETVEITSGSLKGLAKEEIPVGIYVKVLSDEDEDDQQIDTDISLHWDGNGTLIACVEMEWSTENWSNELSPSEYADRLKGIVDHRQDLRLLHSEVGDDFISMRYHVTPESQTPREIWEEALFHVFFTRLTFDQKLRDVVAADSENEEQAE